MSMVDILRDPGFPLVGMPLLFVVLSVGCHASARGSHEPWYQLFWVGIPMSLANIGNYLLLLVRAGQYPDLVATEAVDEVAVLLLVWVTALLIYCAVQRAILSPSMTPWSAPSLRMPAVSRERGLVLAVVSMSYGIGVMYAGTQELANLALLHLPECPKCP